ncbi:putative etoposide-induced protein 2.4 (EI24) [Lyophyllum shimeji]|uniref:Etoposide-induced protein 2.4 (EI24) n=1 Tax=Lyophyllum shimeji TaxID=47721 RepID=A0A9P3PH73_LYOSH|nr:putative etoposide-induced protein 2.4 (EI24) [Lyophyllum shimeji]
MKNSDAEIRANVYKSLLLNSLSLISIYTFDLLLLPLVRDQQRWFHRNIGWFYQVLWLLPVVGASFYLNSSWCSIIAKRTYILQYGARAAAHQQPTTYTGMLTAIATSAYRVVMVFNSVVVSFALHNIPYVGGVAGFVFLCWIDAYYCFEFVWMARGMSLARRIRHLEERWAYYFAFGLPSAALCTFGTGLANAAIFALVFPAYIILAMVARPVPVDPYNPLPATSHADGSELIRHPSPFVPIRLPIFAVVIWLNDTIVRILSVGPPKRPGNSRTLSDTTDTVEEGENMELKEVPRPPIRPTRDRINIGRRKLD